MTNYGIIYKFTCKVNGKSYIGQTTNLRFKERIRRHEIDKIDTHFYRSRDLYGWDSFELSIIENNISLDIPNLLNEREIYWINYYQSFDNGYNSTRGGDGGNTYEKKTEEEMKIIRKKLSESSFGSKNGMSKGIKIINEVTGEIQIFETMTSVGKFFNVHRRSIGRWIKSGKVIDNWKIIFLD